jgi:uncharacterized membrane protein YfcA
VITYSEPIGLALVALVSLAGGAVNSIAGGGTVLTFPALVWLGMDPKLANATSKVGLWWASAGGAWGYRRDLRSSRRELVLMMIPSLLGGATGAILVGIISSALFDFLVPWLMITATTLFIVQRPLAARLRRKDASSDPDERNFAPKGTAMVIQFLLAVYGGFFGAGIGILILAILGFMGIPDIQERNGIKNIVVLAMNGIAVVVFVIQGMVTWSVAVVMVVGAVVGGYYSAIIARYVGNTVVNVAVVSIGILSTIWTALQLS